MTQLLYTKDKKILKDFIKNKGIPNVPTGMFEEPNKILVINVDNTSFDEVNKIMDDYFFKGGSDVVLESGDFFDNYSDIAIINKGVMLATTN